MSYVSDIVNTKWEIVVDLSKHNGSYSNGSEATESQFECDAIIDTNVTGRVNFGRLRTYILQLFSSRELSDSEFNFMTYGKNQPEFNQTAKFGNWRRIFINFDGYDIRKGNKYNFGYRYYNPACFSVQKRDFYYHRATHNEQKLVMKINFPQDINLLDYDITYVHVNAGGDDSTLKELDKLSERMDCESEPNYVEWTIANVLPNHMYGIEWAPKKLPQKIGKRHPVKWGDLNQWEIAGNENIDN